MEIILRPDPCNLGENGKPGSIRDDFMVSGGAKLKVNCGMIGAMKSKEAIGAK